MKDRLRRKAHPANYGDATPEDVARAPLSANVRDTAGSLLNSGGHTLARRINARAREQERVGCRGGSGPGG